MFIDENETNNKSLENVGGKLIEKKTINGYTL